MQRTLFGYYILVLNFWVVSGIRIDKHCYLMKLKYVCTKQITTS